MPDEIYLRRLPLGGGPHPMLGRHVEHDPRSLQYPHALATALQSGPVMAGTVWHNSMFDPTSDGRIPVDTRSGVAGGHEYLIDGYEPRTGPDDRYWMTNSWSTSWGQQGRAWFTGADLAVLLADDGDVTVPTPVTVPAPTPTPAPVDADHAFAATLHPWVISRHVGVTAHIATAAKVWLAAKGL